jgi:hypothetical protein
MDGNKLIRRVFMAASRVKFLSAVLAATMIIVLPLTYLYAQGETGSPASQTGTPKAVPAI